MISPNLPHNFRPAAALPFLLLPFLILIMACSGSAPASRPPTPATIHPPPTATPAPPATPAAPAAAPTLAEPPADVPFTQITAGQQHACGLREDATALCWGRDNDFGEQNPPPQAKFRQLAAGSFFTCGLREDGGLLCWGRNNQGQTEPPPGEFTTVTAGSAHACALSVAQVAVCWGEGYRGGWKIEAGGAAFTSIGSGRGYSCGLTAGQDLLCWRNNEPPEITPGPFRYLAAGVDHSCVLRENGSALCQGDNSSRQAEPPSTAFTAIAAGWHHSCGITEAGLLECWAPRPGAPGQRLAAPSGAFTSLTLGFRRPCALRPEAMRYAGISRSTAPRRPFSPHLAEAFGGRAFEQPTDLFPWPGGGLAVVERQGTISIHKDPPDDGAEQAGPPPRLPLDLTASVYCCTREYGMLSATLDPEFEQFPYLYVYYSAKIEDAAPEVRLSRFTVVDGYARTSSELALIKFSNSARSPPRRRRPVRAGRDALPGHRR